MNLDLPKFLKNNGFYHIYSSTERDEWCHDKFYRVVIYRIFVKNTMCYNYGSSTMYDDGKILHHYKVTFGKAAIETEKLDDVISWLETQLEDYVLRTI